MPRSFAPPPFAAGFELSEDLLDRVEVGGVFRQEDEAGSDIHAAVVVAGLKGLRNTPVTKWLSAKGEAVPPVPVP